MRRTAEVNTKIAIAKMEHKKKTDKETQKIVRCHRIILDNNIVLLQSEYAVWLIMDDTAAIWG